MRPFIVGALCLAALGLTGCGGDPKSYRPVAAPAPPPGAATALLDGLDPVTVTAILDRLGREYRVGYDNYGAPLIGVFPERPDATQEMFVLFNGCDDDNRCEDITLVSWDTERNPIHLDMINRWNRDNRFSRAFIDPDYGPVLQMDINGGGGLGPDALSRQIDAYFTALERFTAAIDIV